VPCSRVLSGVEAGLNTAMEKLPDNVAQKVKGKLVNRLGMFLCLPVDHLVPFVVLHAGL
jgi:hypothetical protein